MKHVSALVAAVVFTTGTAVAGPVGPVISAYRSMEAISQVVGTKQVSGYFLARTDTCAVSLFSADAGDESLVTPPTRVDVKVAADDVAELPMGGRVMRIGCNDEADQIRVVVFPAIDS